MPDPKLSETSPSGGLPWSISMLDRFSRHWRLCRPVSSENAIHPSSGRTADHRRDPEEPELGQSPPSLNDRRACAAGGIDRSVGYRNADQVDERQTEPDRNRSEAGGSAPV